MGTSYGGILCETFADTGQLDQETVGEGAMLEGMTMPYTPLHIIPDFPESRLFVLKVCASSA